MIDAAARLRRLDVCDFGPGLTGVELAAVERRFGFTFAADHRAFLAAGLPLNRPGARGWGFPDWRDGDPETLAEQVGWPAEGVLDAVREGWWPWGEPPVDPVAAMRRRLADAPTPVPVFGHRYLVDGPVLSMHATDIVFYGLDLADWVEQEFGGAARHLSWPVAAIPLWSELVS